MIFIIYRSLNYFLNFLKGINWAHMILVFFFKEIIYLRVYFLFINLNSERGSRVAARYVGGGGAAQINVRHKLIILDLISLQ
jgi:hypothetical protein